MLTDIDYSILMTKITALEHRIKQLEERDPLAENYKPYKNPEHSLMQLGSGGLETIEKQLSVIKDQQPLKDCISTINIDDVIRSI